MKRQIIFRGKRLDNGEWVEGSPLYNALGMCYFVLGLSDNSETGIISLRYVRVDPETVGQWTGLIDSSGRHIFEGDIIANGYIYTDLRYEILYNSDMSSFVMKVPSDVQSNGMPLTELFVQRFGRIVIGNIYDNAELLKTE